MLLDPKIPGGPLSEKWDRHKFESKLVNPANRRKYTIIIVGTGLAGASAASSLGELGYNVLSFCIQDSPRRAHSIAAQGGINAAKNYQNDGDSIQRLFYDTVKGGDYRSREGNVYRLAQLSVNIIDQCVAQGVPFAREYGGLLDNRSFGGAQVSRTFYARGQTGQQLLIGAYQSMMRQVEKGTVTSFANREMLDVVVVDGKARGVVVRNLNTGAIERYAGDAVLLCTGGYGTAYYLSTNAVNSNVTAAWRAHKRGALMANPCYTQIHPTCIPVSGTHQSKLTLMSESLRNDGRVWVPKQQGDSRAPEQIPEAERDYYLERRYPSFGNLVPRDVASRNAKAVCDEGRGVGESGLAVYLDFQDAITRLGEEVVRARYANLFDMYSKITDENPYKVPMRIYPAIHYTMGGLWVDYNLMSTIPGLHVLGEANFSDHGANRLGASALMQGLADGYFVIPYTLAHYLGSSVLPPVNVDHDAFNEAASAVQQRIDALLTVRGAKTPRQLHRELGGLLWDEVGMARNGAGLRNALQRIPQLRDEFWQNVSVPGPADNLNKNLEYAGRVADYLEFAEVLALDALHRTESCGGHFREESQTPDGEALRDDENFSYVAAWEFQGAGKAPTLHKEPLTFEYVKPSQRSYKLSFRLPAPSYQRPLASDILEAESWKLKAEIMRILLTVWRQPGPAARGEFKDYVADPVSPDMSFLEMLDVVNEGLIAKGEDPIAFDSDCREGICGTCGFLVSGVPHGPDRGTTVCQLHMRRFKDGDRVTLEPWRARAFPVVKDLVVDRSAFDRIIQGGGYTSVNVGGARDGNAILVSKAVADQAMDAAACIGCGACVAACKNASAALFTAAKVSHLALLPQGQVERTTRVVAMVDRHDSEGFGSCSNEGECEAVCPKEIPITNIARMNREYFKAMLLSRS